MGAVICVPGDISALEKETIVNTRANKTRDVIEKLVRSRSLSPDSRSEAKNRSIISVGFGSIVHERTYLNQEVSSATKFQDHFNNLTSMRNHKKCDSARWNSKYKSDIKCDGKPFRRCMELTWNKIVVQGQSVGTAILSPPEDFS